VIKDKKKFKNKKRKKRKKRKKIISKMKKAMRMNTAIIDRYFNIYPTISLNYILIHFL
jgi:type IV secretory pathway VirB10-like protein